MGKYDKNLEYVADTQTLIGTREKHLVDTETGEAYDVQQITKRIYGTKNFWKIYLMDFMQVLGILDSKQVDILCYIMEHTQAATNTFIGTYKKIAAEVGVSEPTIATVFRKLQKAKFIRKVQNGVWVISPNIMVKGNDFKRNMLLTYFNEQEAPKQEPQQKQETPKAEQDQLDGQMTIADFPPIAEKEVVKA